MLDGTPRSRTLRGPLPTAMLLAVVLLAACTPADGPADGLADGPADGEGTSATDDEVQLVCGNVSIPVPALEAEPSLESLPALDTLDEAARDARDMAGRDAVDPSLDWRVADEDEGGEVVLIRQLDPDEPASTGGDTHETLRLSPPGEFGRAERTAAGGGPCTPRRTDGADDGQVQVRLAEEPAPEDTELHLLVREVRCASGRSAEGRIELDGLTATEDQVRLRLSILPPPGSGQTCPSNPWTDWAVELDEPLGDRTVVDANLVPAQPLVVGRLEVRFDPEAEDRADAVERAVAYEPPPSYTMLLEVDCDACDRSAFPRGQYQVHVRAGEVERREPSPYTGDRAADDPGPRLAPSLAELVERVRAASVETSPESIADIAVDAGGQVMHVTFRTRDGQLVEFAQLSVQLEDADAPLVSR